MSARSFTFILILQPECKELYLYLYLYLTARVQGAGRGGGAELSGLLVLQERGLRGVLDLLR